MCKASKHFTREVIWRLSKVISSRWMVPNQMVMSLCLSASTKKNFRSLLKALFWKFSRSWKAKAHAMCYMNIVAK